MLANFFFDLNFLPFAKKKNKFYFSRESHHHLVLSRLLEAPGTPGLLLHHALFIDLFWESL
jgi:hypothetical protein